MAWRWWFQVRNSNTEKISSPLLIQSLRSSEIRKYFSLREGPFASTPHFSFSWFPSSTKCIQSFVCWCMVTTSTLQNSNKVNTKCTLSFVFHNLSWKFSFLGCANGRTQKKEMLREEKNIALKGMIEFEQYLFTTSILLESQGNLIEKQIWHSS